MTVQVRLPVGTIALDPGCETSCDVAVANTGPTADRFSFEVLGTAASWTTLDPPVLALDAGAAGLLRVLFHPPRAAHVRAGRAPFGLLTTSERGRASSVVEELLALGRFADLSAELLPPIAEGPTGAYRLAVHSDGNTVVHLTVVGRDPDGWLTIDCSPQALTIFPGTTGWCRVGARPRDRLWRGPSTVHRFQVIARPQGEDPITVVGTLLHRPLLRWRAGSGDPVR